MIIDGILEFFLTPILNLFEMLPEFDLTIPDGAYSNMVGFCECLGFVMPMPLIIYCLGVKLFMYQFKIVMALIVRIKSFVPFWGS